MKNQRLIIIGGIAVVILLIVIFAISNRGSGTTAEPTAAPGQQTLLEVPLNTPQATQTLSAAPTAIVAVNGASCGGDCMWSAQCVSGRYTIAEAFDSNGVGMTQVHENSCIPYNFLSWFIRPDDPFAGMPCAFNDRSCMWSSQCVTDFGVPAEKNGLARVVRNSCQLVP